MASISSILSILVQADTGDATNKLQRFDKQIDAAQSKAAQGVKAQLGGDFDERAFGEYDRALDKAQRRVRDRAAFKAALGADFNARAFNEYQRALDRAESDSRRAQARAESDSQRAQARVRDLERDTVQAIGRLRDLQVQAGRVPDHIEIKADADTGVAEAKLDLLNAKIRETEREAGRLSLGLSTVTGGAGGAAGGGGGFLSNLGGNLGGGLPLGGPLALGVGLAPLVAGAIGSAIPLAGSAGAGLLGAGAIGAAGFGAGGAGLGSILALSGGLKDAIKLSGQLKTQQDALATAEKLYAPQNKALATAQANYNAAVAAFGPTSKQAVAAHQQLLLAQQKQATVAPQVKSAQDALNKTMAGAEPATLAVAKAFVKVQEAWKDAEQQVLPQFAALLKPILDTFTALLPTLTQMASISLGGIATGLKPLLDIARSPEVHSLFVQLAENFAKLAPVVMRGVGDLMLIFLRTAVAAGPPMLSLASSIAGMLDKAAAFTRSAAFGPFIAKVIGQFESWLRLAEAVGRTLFTIFSAGASQGQSLVDQLTQIVDHFNKWLNTTTGQQKLKQFFTDSLNLLKGVFGILGALLPLIASMATGLIPPMALLAQILGTISQWANHLAQGLPPVINALPGLAVTVGVLAAWQALGALISAVVTSIGDATKAMLGLGVAERAAATGGSVAATAAAGAGERTAASRIPLSAAPLLEGGAGGLTAEAVGASLKSLVVRGLGIAGIGTLVSQALGSAIKGGLGSAIKAVGTGAAIGGGLGMLFGPWGAAVGAAIGAGVGFAVAHAHSDGQKWANAFTSDLPNQISRKVTDALAKTKDRLTVDTRLLAPRQAGPGQLAPQERTRLTAAEQKQFFNLGWEGGRAVVQGLQSVKVPTEFIILRDFQTKLKAFPAQARAEAASVMIQWAASLERNGRLPKGSLDKIIKSLEAQIPGLQSYLQQQGANTANVIAKAMTLTQAQANWKRALLNFGNQYVDLAINQKITSSNIVRNTAQAMADLKVLMTTGPKQQRQAATAEYNKLKDQVAKTYSSMLSDVETKQASMSKTIKHGSADAAKTASNNFWGFAGQIHDAEAAGLLSSQRGSQMISDALNSTLKAFGAAPISIPKIAGTIAKIGQSVSNFVSGFAVGGYVGTPGEHGRDTVPAMLGRGEAVLNHQQQALANVYLAPIGGLPGLFSTTQGSKHYMAGGGFAGVRGYDTGGYVFPFPGLSVERTDQGKDFGGAGPVGAIGPGVVVRNTEWTGWPGSGGIVYRLTAGARAGSNVYVMEDFQASLPVGAIVTAGQIIGRALGGSSGIEAGWANASATGPLTPYNGAADGTPMPGGIDFANFVLALARGVLVGGSGFAQIQVPKVQGTGTLATMVRATLTKETAAANAYLASHIPMVGGAPGPFTAGGGNWLATAYGPPWGGIEGGGVTATGVNLTAGQQAYIIAADPSVIPMHSKVKVWPNPFDYAGAFSVEDTGGAIKGHHIDIYDWLGRAHQNAWGARNVNVTQAAAGGFIGKASGGFIGGTARDDVGGMARDRRHHKVPKLPKLTDPLAMYAPSGRKKPHDKPGWKTVGLGHGIWEYVPKTGTLVPQKGHAVGWQGGALGMPAAPVIAGPPPDTIAGAGQVQAKIRGLRNQVSVLEHQYGTLDQFYNITPEQLLDPTTGELNRPAIAQRLAQLDRLMRIRRQIFQAWQRIVAWERRLVASNRLMRRNLERTLGKIKGHKVKGDASQTQQSIDATTGNLTQAIGDLTSATDDRDTAWVSLLQLRADRATVAGTKAQPTGSTVAAASTDPQQVQMLQQLLQQSQLATAVSQAQYQVLSDWQAKMPPFGGSFAAGGVVPGPAGAPRTIVAHGGEVVGNGTASVEVRVVMEDHRTRVFVNDVERTVEQAGRGSSRYAARRLPGRGY